MYFLDVMTTNSAWVGLILDKDIIFVVLSWIIMVAFPKRRAWRIANNFFFKESNLYYLGWLVNYETNARAHTNTNINARILIYTYTHTYTHTRKHIDTHTHTRMHKKTHACTHACARVHPHTHKVFFRDRRPEFEEPLTGHCHGGLIHRVV